MSEQQMEDRSRSLHDAVQRMSHARAARGTDPVFAELSEGALLTTAERRRRSVFGFADRARAAVQLRRGDS